MFSDPWSQERFIVGLQAFMFTALSDADQFHKRLIALGKSHAAKGVKAVEYGIIGEVFFYSFIRKSISFLKRPLRTASL
jgi:hypothetical protein